MNEPIGDTEETGGANEANGGNLPDSILSRGTRDTRLLAKAIKKRWPIPDEYRESLIKRQVKIAIDPGSSPREATSAFKAIVAAERQNQEDEHHAEGETHRHEHAHVHVTTDEQRMRLAALADRLRIDVVPPVASAGETDGDPQPTLPVRILEAEGGTQPS